MKVGDKVKVVKDILQEGASSRFIGKTAIILSMSDNIFNLPIKVKILSENVLEYDDINFFKEEELEVIEEANAKK